MNFKLCITSAALLLYALLHFGCKKNEGLSTLNVPGGTVVQEKDLDSMNTLFLPLKDGKLVTASSAVVERNDRILLLTARHTFMHDSEDSIWIYKRRKSFTKKQYEDAWINRKLFGRANWHKIPKSLFSAVDEDFSTVRASIDFVIADVTDTNFGKSIDKSKIMKLADTIDIDQYEELRFFGSGDQANGAPRWKSIEIDKSDLFIGDGQNIGLNHLLQHGDSGGPLVGKTKDGKQMLLALDSGKRGDGLEGLVGVTEEQLKTHSSFPGMTCLK